MVNTKNEFTELLGQAGAKVDELLSYFDDERYEAGKNEVVDKLYDAKEILDDLYDRTYAGDLDQCLRFSVTERVIKKVGRK
jgi:hypothetical protein